MRRYLLSLIAVGLWPTLTFAQTSTQVVEYYHTDALGSVRAVTKVVNGQTQVVSRHDFKPFGEEVAPQTPPVDKRLFTGKERDAETGQDYFGARYYPADLGRFTTIDPVQTWEENLADPQRWNRYAYVRNNPLRWVDPTGEEIGVSANEQERKRLEQDTRDALGDAGQYVSIQWENEKQRWQYVISGISIDAFKSIKGAEDVACKFADLVTSNQLVWVKVTTERLENNGAGFAFDIGTRGGNQEPVVALNYRRETAMVEGSQHWRFFEKNFDKGTPASAIRPLTMGITLLHELGHAWGNIHGRRTAARSTWKEAIDWENAARRATYPLGPNAMRRWHR
jgi:RHS repeat-associated protein